MNELPIGIINNLLVKLNLNRLNNRHITIFGASGSGKSVMLQRIVLEQINIGATILAFDSHHTLNHKSIFPSLRQPFTKAVHDIDVKDHGVSIPIFSTLLLPDGTMEDEYDAISSTVDTFCRVFCLGARQRATLRKAFETVKKNGSYEEFGFAAVGTALQCMVTDRADSIYERMAPLFHHNIFREGTNFLAENSINVLRISNLDLHLQWVVVEVVLSHIWRLASAMQLKKGLSIVVDEAQNVSFSKESPIAKLLTEGRKFGVGMIIATQFLPGDSDAQNRLFQSSTVMSFRPSDLDVMTVAKLIDPNNKDTVRHILPSLKQGEYVISGDAITSGAVEMNGVPIRKPIRIYNKLDAVSKGGSKDDEA